MKTSAVQISDKETEYINNYYKSIRKNNNLMRKQTKPLKDTF